MRAGLIRVGWGIESETPHELLDARVEITYVGLDTLFGLRPVEALPVPEVQLEYDA